MRVLHLTNKPIYPLLDGGCVAMNQLSKLLIQQGFEVKNLSIETSKHPFNLEDFPEEFKAQFKPEAVLLNTELSFWGALKHLISGKSYNLARFISEDFEKAIISTLLESKVDLVFCESIYLLPYLDSIRKHSKAKIIVRTHNVEFEIWNQLATQSSPIKRWYLNKLSNSLRKEELELLQKADAIVAISESDALAFKQNGIKTPITVIPVAIDQTNEVVSSPKALFHHIGSMNWAPNLEAVNYLISTLFPAIRQQLPEAELHLAGSFFPSTIQSSSKDGIFVHGFVEDRFQFISEHGIKLVPLKSGSGVRIKLLESLSNGVPIVTTKIGAEGLAPGIEKALIITENDANFISNAVELYKNDELRSELGGNAIHYIHEQYSFDSVNKLFIEFLQSIS